MLPCHLGHMIVQDSAKVVVEVHHALQLMGRMKGITDRLKGGS